MAMHIKNLLDSLVPQDQQWKWQLLQNWQTIIGNLKTRVSLEKIMDEILVLGVVDSSWMQELYLLSPIILRTINANLDRPRIKQLRFKQLRKNFQKKTITAKPNHQVINCITLTKKEETTLQQIKDPQLRTALKKFLIRCHHEKMLTTH